MSPDSQQISETKKTPFELHFRREPGTKLSNLKNAVSVDSKDLQSILPATLPAR